MSTAKKLNKSNFVRTPFGAFNKNHVISITPTDSGVAVFGDGNALIFWLEEKDEKKARKVADALTDAVIDGAKLDWKQLGYVPA
ncbi:hypothetical protein ACFSJY_02630 [Thalassotalea euphylliae]|uniref:hypothetical protein n=1 Tax=Thalassotalea euphylliae TaxID=1655234 RepID=UPI00363B5EA8